MGRRKIHIFWWVKPKGKQHLEDLNEDRRIITKLILKTKFVKV
jgi:hypothetical protein